MQLKVLSEFCNYFKNLQPFDVVHVMVHVHWNVGKYLLPIPLCFVLLKVKNTFLFFYKEDLWVVCFVHLLAFFAVKKSRSCLF